MLKLDGALLATLLAGSGLAGSGAFAQTNAPVAADDQVAMPASIGAAVASTVASTDTRLLSPCSIINLRASQPGTVPLLAVACGTVSVIVGEAVSYRTAYNAAQSRLLIVRQRGARTYVSAVVVGTDGGTHLDDLTPGLEKGLSRAGRIRSPLLDVDLTTFAATGTIVVTPRLAPAIQIKAGATPPTTDAVAIDVLPVQATGASRANVE